MHMSVSEHIANFKARLSGIESEMTSERRQSVLQDMALEAGEIRLAVAHYTLAVDIEDRLEKMVTVSSARSAVD